jgi:hypothetical protein
VEETEHDKSAETGAKGGQKSAENRSKSRGKHPETTPKTNEHNDLTTIGLDQNSELARASLPEPYINPPTPLPGGWDEFQRVWPVKGDLTKARPAFERLSEEDRKAAIEFTPRYRAEAREFDRTLCSARTFLGERKWAEASTPSTKPRGDKMLIWPGQPAWDAWTAYFNRLRKLDPKTARLPKLSV